MNFRQKKDFSRRGWKALTLGIMALVVGMGVMALPATASPPDRQATPTPFFLPTNTFVPEEVTATPTEVAPTPLPATLTPTLTFTMTPPTVGSIMPPTVLYPLNPEPGAELGGTAVPTAMPRFIPRDREGNPYEVYNFLLIGEDSESVEQAEGVFRTDTMIVVHVNATTGTVAMLSLPRDLYVYIPDWTMQRLNLAWGRGEAVGWTDGGYGLLRQTILYNFGIQIHYYAKVDFGGFKSIIDTLGGVTIAVDCPIQDYLFTGDYDANGEPLFDFVTIEPGVRRMNSTEALFYSRSRRNSSDFDRGRRQQQLLRALWQEGKSGGWLADVPTLYNQLTQVVETNVPLEVMLKLAPFALTIEPNAVENHFFQLGYETRSWGAPDGSNVQLPNAGALIETIRNEFLVPPTQNRLVTDAARIAIYDNSGRQVGYDVVAVQRILFEGLVGEARGIGVPPDEFSVSNEAPVIIDYSGSRKGSSVNALAEILQVPPSNIFVSPDPNRDVDIAVYLNPGYNPCVGREIIAPTTSTPTP